MEIKWLFSWYVHVSCLDKCRYLWWALDLFLSVFCLRMFLSDMSPQSSRACEYLGTSLARRPLTQMDAVDMSLQIRGGHILPTVGTSSLQLIKYQSYNQGFQTNITCRQNTTTWYMQMYYTQWQINISAYLNPYNSIILIHQHLFIHVSSSSSSSSSKFFLSYKNSTCHGTRTASSHEF